MRKMLSILSILLGCIGIGNGQTIHTCTEIPVTPLALQPINPKIPDLAARAVSYKPQYGLYWAKGSTITVRLIGGSDYVRDKVKYYAKMWTEYANLDFQFINYGAADIRVSFVQNGSSWSVIGKQSLQVAGSQATMNFGWLNDFTPEYEFKRTILHEFGHALGLLHEHQNPTGGIPWDYNAVYSHYWQTQGWDKQTTYQNVIKKASRNATQFSHYDPHSIMHYPVSSALTNGTYQIGINQNLSSTDIAYIKQVYPGRSIWKPSTPPNAGETTTKPSDDWVKTKPKKEAFIVTISNQLGQNQVAETIDLYLGGSKYSFQLDENGKKQQAFRFRMTQGKYSYKLSSASTYQFSRKVWNGWRYVRKKVERTIYGEGSGALDIKEGGTYTLYGDYNKETKRMRVYLGEVNETPRLANTKTEE